MRRSIRKSSRSVHKLNKRKTINENKKPNKITYDLDTMLDGYDGVTGRDYKWKMIDDPKVIINIVMKSEYSDTQSKLVKGFRDNSQWRNH